jgi:hypothetical protein
MGKIKLLNEQDFDDWVATQLSLSHNISELAKMSRPKSYPVILCYKWIGYGSYLNYDYVYQYEF